MVAGEHDDERRLVVERCQRVYFPVSAPELAEDARFATNAERQAERGELVKRIEDHLRSASRADWLARLERYGIPAGPILDLAEAFESPVANERQMRVEVDHPSAGRISQVGAPWKLDGHSSPIRLAPPTLGQHTAEVLHDVLGRPHD
jgi:crotonobetainyl-CoA:carnitine CoA-transferase CaiB-like acyl-CoA transferase